MKNVNKNENVQTLIYDISLKTLTIKTVTIKTIKQYSCKNAKAM